jgi:hypothetical protein
MEIQMSRMVYGGRQYPSVHAYRRPVSSHVTGVAKKRPMDAQERFDFDVKKAQGVPAAVNAIDVARNAVEITTHWKRIFAKSRKSHRKIPDVPEAALDALIKLGEKLPRIPSTKARRSR